MGAYKKPKRRPTHHTMKILRLLCLGLFAGQARGAACALGVVGDFFNEVAGVDKSFHRKLPTDTSKWGKLICGVLKLAQSTVDVTLGMDVSWWKLAFLSEADKKIVVSGPASHIFVAPRSHLCARATSANLYLRAGKRRR